MRRLSSLIALLATVVAAPPAGAAWRPPVDAPLASRFAYSPARPFAAGRRRGIDFAPRPGAPVRAPCAGHVTYAGPVPGRGLGVTLRCGHLTATLLGLSSLAVRGGSLALPGAPVGRASGAVPLRLGARVTGRRFAYLDPLPLLGGHAPAPPRPSAPPLGPRPRPRAGPPVPEPAIPPRPRAGRVPASARVPLAAWLGAALLAATLSAGVALPRLRRRARMTVIRRG